MSSSNCCFLTCIQISQEAGQVVWYSQLLKNCLQFVVIPTVKGFSIFNKEKVDVFLELSCFFNDPAHVGTLIAPHILTSTRHGLSPLGSAMTGSRSSSWLRGMCTRCSRSDQVCRVCMDSGLGPQGWLGRGGVERRPSFFTSGPCLWRNLRGHPHQELELALTGSVAPWPPTRGDGQGIPIHRLLASLRWESAMTVTSSRPGGIRASCSHYLIPASSDHLTFCAQSRPTPESAQMSTR